MSATLATRRFIDAPDLDAALETLSSHGEELTVLAGGTDVMVQYLRGDIRPAGLLHVRRLRELRDRELGERSRLGALTTHWQIRTDADVRRRHPALAEAAATVGGRQTQNVGTLAGNVVNASPAADLLPVLLVSGAAVELAAVGGRRELRLDDFVLGRRETARRPDELVTALTLEPLSPRSAETYLKLGRRHAMEVAIVGLALRLTLGADGSVADVRIALGSVGPKAFRCTEAEARLRAGPLNATTVGEAGALVMAAAAPIDDVRATAAYRQRVLPALLAHAVESCRRTAAEAGA